MCVYACVYVLHVSWCVYVCVCVSVGTVSDILAMQTRYARVCGSSDRSRSSCQCAGCTCVHICVCVCVVCLCVHVSVRADVCVYMIYHIRFSCSWSNCAPIDDICVCWLMCGVWCVYWCSVVLCECVCCIVCVCVCVYMCVCVCVYAQDFGVTPLMLASEHGHCSTVKLLLDNGAHVNVQNKVYTQTHSYVHVRTHTHTHTHVHTRTHYARTRIHTYTYTNTQQAHIHLYTHTPYTRTHTHVHAHHKRKSIRLQHTQMHTQTHTSDPTFTHIHTHAHTYTHTYTHTHAHTQKGISSLWMAARRAHYRIVSQLVEYGANDDTIAILFQFDAIKSAYRLGSVICIQLTYTNGQHTTHTTGTHAHMHTYTYIRTTPCSDTHTCTYPHAHIHTYICTHNKHTSSHVILFFTDATHAYTHTHTHTHAHTHTHTHTYTTHTHARTHTHKGRTSFINRTKLSFLLGFHPRIGANSAIHTHFDLSDMFDQNLIQCILSFVHTHTQTQTRTHTYTIWSWHIHTQPHTSFNRCVRMVMLWSKTDCKANWHGNECWTDHHKHTHTRTHTQYMHTHTTQHAARNCNTAALCGRW